MRYFKNINDYQKDEKLCQLLAQRRAPLSEEGMRIALTDLTLYLCSDVEFIGSAFLKDSSAEQLSIADIDKADMMEGTDGERYFPVFTNAELFFSFKPQLKDGETLLLFTKQDLLEFLNGNDRIAAVVANPMEDDLLLYRVQLSNMIALARQKENG